MELKRILARDARTANEKAIAQFGPDVMIISSSQVNGMTELIVALDLPELTTMEADPHLRPEYVNSNARQTPGKFDVLLGQTIEDNKRTSRQTQATKVAQPIVEIDPRQKPQAAAKNKSSTSAQRVHAIKAELDQVSEQEQDGFRIREIVTQVREELASLRREFKLSQQVAAWQGNMPLPPALTPLRDALNEAPMPVALRALLIDSIKDFNSIHEALVALRKQLIHTVNQELKELPKSGIHALAGPSGSGKSMMIARLAQQAAMIHGSERVMVVSFHDQRAGAWSQTQLLCAHSGVDCFRASSAGTLKLLLEEHEGKKLILIDTPGVQMDERLADVRAVAPQVEFHAVIPADASSAVVRRVFENTDNVWNSLMISKLDESSQPWALLQYLSDHRLAVSAASQGDQSSDLIQEMCLADLVQCALDGLQLDQQAAMSPADVALNAVASAKLAEIAAKTQTQAQQV